ncbi:aldo/keto reductase [Actinoplanes sp. NPDC023714]|uniref:aldo/keto reductase n=1 Tax=Actinoplanes sp. NPDC023714 TaxID=3154322 RepID=UPI0033E4C61D
MHLTAASPSSARVLRRAAELGITLIDTAFLYGGGDNEQLIAETLHPYPADLVVTTKVGVARTGPGGEWRLDGRPSVLRSQVDQALLRLRLPRLELLQLHRIDPDTPPADQLGTLRDLQLEGKIGRIGLSEVSVAELAEARTMVEVASVQNRYNILDRTHEAVLEVCERDGIAFLPWRPIAAGASGEAAVIGKVASEVGATPTQVALAWLLARSPVMIPIPGTGSVEHLEENAAAAEIRLTVDQRAALDGLWPPTQPPLAH